MASLPLSAITALFRTGDSSVVSGSYRLERDAGIVRLSHYGTLIATVDGSTCAFHGSSASDRDAANSLFELMGVSTRVRYESASRTESPRVRERLRFILGEAGRPADAARIEGARSRTARDQALSVVGGHSS